MNAPYREETAFELATGTRALAEMRRAARPGLLAPEALLAIALTTCAGVVASDRWHDYRGFVVTGVLVFTAWAWTRQANQLARKQMARPLRTRGWLDEAGVVLEWDGGGSARWSWERVTFDRRTPTALTIFVDTDTALVILAETNSRLDRIEEVARARAGARWRAPSRWMLAVVLGQLLLTGVALRPAPLDTPRARIESALDRHVEPTADDLDAMAYGSLCDRVALDTLASDAHRRDLLPCYPYDEGARVRVAADLETCDEDAITPRGRVIVDDDAYGRYAYFVLTVRGMDGFVVAGPYGEFADEAWTHPVTSPGPLDVDLAMRTAATMHGRVTGRMPTEPPHFDLALHDDDE